MTELHAPTLTDGVVTLRAHRLDDAERVHEQCQDPVSQAWTTVPIPYSRDDARRFVTETMPAGWRDDTEWAFAIEVDGRFGGTCSLRNLHDGRAEVAYGSHPAIRGTGAVGRALRLLVDWGFDQHGLHAIIWLANRGNWSSRKAAWRLGFTLDGTLSSWLPQRGEYLDAWVGTLRHDEPREPRNDWLVPPILEADGLRLRPFAETDVPRIVEACTDPETEHWLGRHWLGRLEAPYDEHAAQAYLEDLQDRHASGTALTWAVTDPETDLLIGSMGIFDWTPQTECEIGYWAHPAARGRGMTTRAMGLVTAYAFEELGIIRAVAMAAAGNTASRRVIAANGFRETGVERLGIAVGDGRDDLVIYDLLAVEFRAARAATTSTANPPSDSSAPTTSGDR